MPVPFFQPLVSSYRTTAGPPNSLIICGYLPSCVGSPLRSSSHIPTLDPPQSLMSQRPAIIHPGYQQLPPQTSTMILSPHALPLGFETSPMSSPSCYVIQQPPMESPSGLTAFAAAGISFIGPHDFVVCVQHHQTSSGSSPLAASGGSKFVVRGNKC